MQVASRLQDIPDPPRYTPRMTIETTQPQDQAGLTDVIPSNLDMWHCPNCQYAQVSYAYPPSPCRLCGDYVCSFCGQVCHGCRPQQWLCVHCLAVHALHRAHSDTDLLFLYRNRHVVPVPIAFADPILALQGSQMPIPSEIRHLWHPPVRMPPAFPQLPCMPTEAQTVHGVSKSHQHYEGLGLRCTPESRLTSRSMPAASHATSCRLENRDGTYEALTRSRN